MRNFFIINLFTNQFRQRVNLTQIIIIALLLGLPKCDGSRTICGIKIPYMLIYTSEDSYQTDYCDLVEKSLNGDASSLMQLTKLRFDNGYLYDHGYVLIGILDAKGEPFFISAIDQLSSVDKEYVTTCLMAGVDVNIGNGGSYTPHSSNNIPRYSSILKINRS